MSKKDELDMSPDAALAVEHTPEREAEQLSYFGGEKDEIDDYDASEEDDGSVVNVDPNAAPAAESPKDEDTEEEASDEEDDDGDADEAEESSDDDVEEEASDDDDSAESESEDEADDEEDEAAAKPKGIPKHRFDEVNERRKAAEQELADLKAEKQAEKQGEEETFDFDEAEGIYQDLLLDGDTDGAKAKRGEIRAAEKAEWKREALGETKQDLNLDDQRADLQDMYTQAEEMFDAFNPDHEDYRQDLVDKTLVFYKGYMAEGGMSPADAFVAGLADVVDMADLVEVDAEADPKPKPTGKKKVGGKKKADAKAKAHTPVGGEGSGSADTGAAVPNVEEMSDEDFDALPDKTQARLRGDVI